MHHEPDTSNGHNMEHEGGPALPDPHEDEVRLNDQNPMKESKVDDEDEILEMLYGPADDDGFFTGEAI